MKLFAWFFQIRLAARRSSRTRQTHYDTTPAPAAFRGEAPERRSGPLLCGYLCRVRKSAHIRSVDPVQTTGWQRPRSIGRRLARKLRGQGTVIVSVMPELTPQHAQLATATRHNRPAAPYHC